MSEQPNPTPSNGPKKRRKRRSPEFMHHVSVRMDAWNMTFIEAVRSVAEDREEIGTMDRLRADEKRLAAEQLERWNATVPEGTAVEYRVDVHSEWLPTRTCSDAFMVCGHPSVFIAARSGSYSLDFVRLPR